MEKTKERKTLEAIIKLVADGKTVIIEPDIGIPYTIWIQDEDGSGYHTHSSYFNEDDYLTNQAMEEYVESLMNHILGEAGLSWHRIDKKQDGDDNEI